MSNTYWIRGAGGGGSTAPVEDDDTLFSDSKASVIDLLSEGEIVGLLSAQKSIYLNETPLQDSAGNSNFDDVSYQTRPGTNSQDSIPGFVGTENSVGVNVKVTKTAGAVEKTFSSTTVDAVRVILNTPALLDGDNDNGDLHGSTVSFKIYRDKNNEGNWVEHIADSFTGKTSSKYERAYRLDIPQSWKSAGFTSISIKVERTSDDADDTAKIQNELYFNSYTKIIDNKLRYPNSAIIASQFDARQFTSIPNRSYEIKGVKIKVPSNYTPYDPGHCTLSGYRRKDRCTQAGGEWIQGTCSDSDYTTKTTCLAASNTWTGSGAVGDNLYSGSWDGTFDIAWTCNPAWILYDLCTDERYGLGKWLSASQMDKWSLYEIGKYCDAVDSSGNFVGVDDGWTNKEARFACNLYLQGREEAFKVLNDISSIFRGMIYWQQGQISAVQDAPKDPVMNFSDANVINGTFTYEGTSRKQRHNVAHVTWNNPEDFYRQNVEYVEDAPGILVANNQIFSTDVIAVGCTSQGQARRVGKWILYTERYETEVISFSTGMEGAAIRPGDLIKVADSHKAGVRYGGRIASGSTTTTIKLDSPTTVTGHKDYMLSVINTEAACIRAGVKQSISALSCSNASYSTEDTCLQSSGTCSGGTATGSEDYDACICIIDAIWTPTNTWTSPQSICLNAHIDNEWKPYVWVETKDVSYVSSDALVTELTVTSAFENTPTVNHMWILEEIGTVEAQDFRVLMTRESGPNIVEVSALRYHGAKYGLIEENITFSTKSTSSLPNPSDPIPAPSNLSIKEELYVDSMSNVKNRAEFSWEAPKTTGTSTTYPYVASYYVEWRRTSPITNWISMGETSAQSVIIDDAPAGTLEFRVKTRRIF
jgi:predicted phage tail protein